MRTPACFRIVYMQIEQCTRAQVYQHLFVSTQMLMGLFVPHSPRANVVSVMICLTVVRRAGQTMRVCTWTIVHVI